MEVDFVASEYFTVSQKIGVPQNNTNLYKDISNSNHYKRREQLKLTSRLTMTGCHLGKGCCRLHTCK